MSSAPAPTADREARIKQALRALADGTHTSIRQAAKAHGIPRSTLQGRRLGNTSRARSHGGQQRLSAVEEEALARICVQLDAWGGCWPGTREALECLATKFIEAKEAEGGDGDGDGEEQDEDEDELKGRKGQGDSPDHGAGAGAATRNHRRLGINWHKNFRNRHPEVKLIKKTYNRRHPDGRWLKIGEVSDMTTTKATTATTAMSVTAGAEDGVHGNDGKEGGRYNMPVNMMRPTSGYMPLEQGIPQGTPQGVQQDVVSASYFLPKSG